MLATAVAIGGRWPYRLADPQTADREGLVRWLVVRDLARESYENQQVLAYRLDEEFFTADFDWNEVSGQLSAPQQRQLIENLVVLFVPWCRDKAAHFATQTPEGRETFLDETLDRLELLVRAGEMIGQGEGDLSETLATRMLGEAEKLPLGIPGREADEVRHFLDSLRHRWLVRQFGRWFPPS